MKYVLLITAILILTNCSDTNTIEIEETNEEVPTDDTAPPSDQNTILQVTQVGTLPEAVSNNAVVEGFINEIPYLFSFGGIDGTKEYAGIHLRSYRYNIQTNTADQIPDLPDTLGKIASAASRIGNMIYISGGYHVHNNGSEITSGKMHRYDIVNNVFLEDAPDIPIPTDDHVQAVWNNQLIYLITGWSQTANIPNVQIYDPTQNIWLSGTPVPGNNYRSFGASGTIAGNTIYYFGGATSNSGFGIQNQVRIGTIDPDDPTQITWDMITPDATINGYRMAATTVHNELHWVGGSTNTYNFNGIAYDGSGGVPPSQRDLYTETDVIEWQENTVVQLPMDLRGIANISETVKYLAGGMGTNQTVTNAVYKLEWSE
jgi:hypothetical protein